MCRRKRVCLIAGRRAFTFPATGLCSIINKMADGGGIEVACIGNEGVVGLNALAGECPEERNGFVQVADGTVRVHARGVL